MKTNGSDSLLECPDLGQIPEILNIPINARNDILRIAKQNDSGGFSLFSVRFLIRSYDCLIFPPVESSMVKFL